VLLIGVDHMVASGEKYDWKSEVEMLAQEVARIVWNIPAWQVLLIGVDHMAASGEKYDWESEVEMLAREVTRIVWKIFHWCSEQKAHAGVLIRQRKRKYD
jgi:hypothetical protein